MVAPFLLWNVFSSDSFDCLPGIVHQENPQPQVLHGNLLEPREAKALLRSLKSNSKDHLPHVPGRAQNRSGNGADGLDGDLGDEGLVAGDMCVAGIGGVDGGEPCDMEQRAQGMEPPAGEDDIVGGKQEREPFRRRIAAAFEHGIGIELVVVELRVGEAVDASFAGEKVEHQQRVLAFLDTAGFFVGRLSGT